MAITVSDYLLHRLSEWGVRRLFGYPGDGINGVLGALERSEDQFELVRTTHEEVAAFMACAHAKYTGTLGVCIATSGPGAIHLLNGLYDAKMDHAPVLAIVGQAHRAALGGAYQQEVDLHTLFKDVAHEFCEEATAAPQIRHLVDRAVRIALSQRTVTCIILPGDVQELEYEAPPRAHETVHSGVGYSAPVVIPAEPDLQRAAGVLNDGRRVAILVGAGALGASDEVLKVADVLGAGIAKALLGKAVVPDSLPYVTGAIGLLGTRPSWQMMNDCDTLFVIGSGFPYSEYLPREGSARGVQIDIDPRMLSLRYPMEVGLTGDARETLKALMPYLERKGDRTWREEVEGHVDRWREVVDARAKGDAAPLNPQRVFHEMSSRLPDNAILAADSGTVASWYARDVTLRPGMKGTLSGGLATMSPGVPYALAAKFAFPDRVAIAMVGDGAMQMLGNQALLTAAHYWKQWSDPRLIVLVLNNRDLNMVTWEMRVMEGNPKLESSQFVDDFPYARYAELIGLRGIRVDAADQVGRAWDEAFASDRPVVLEAVTDADTPPLPPHITVEQARHFTRAMLKGDPDEAGVIRQTIKEIMETVLPR
ncbi:MAG: thiamine pyrophosphate-requiring protein [Gemmatimonadales bacterium]